VIYTDITAIAIKVYSSGVCKWSLVRAFASKSLETNKLGLSSLQLQVGIIAACASSLKPLVRRLLRLPSTDYKMYDRSGSHVRPNNSVALVTIGGTRNGPSKDGLESHQHGPNCRVGYGDSDGDSDRSDLCLTNQDGKDAATTTSWLFKQPLQGNLSEEMMLPRKMEPLHLKNEGAKGTPHPYPKGILRRTEVTVVRSESKRQ
jgi:hypothetical protein